MAETAIKYGDTGRLYTRQEVDQIVRATLRDAELRLEGEAQAAQGVGRRAAARSSHYRRAAEIVKAVRLRHA
jgi:hypothetical protein